MVVLLVMVSVLSMGCSGNATPRPPVGIAALCQPILHDGLFHSEALADDALRRIVDSLACERLPQVHLDPASFGFGVGASVLGGQVVELDYGRLAISFAPEAHRRWFEANCSGNLEEQWKSQRAAWRQRLEEAMGPTDKETPPHAGWAAEFRRQELEAWRPAHEILPAETVAAWRQCVAPEGLVQTGVGRLVCQAFAAPTSDGPVLFQVDNLQMDVMLIPFVQIFMGPTLAGDVTVEGATCSGSPWLKGKQFPDLHRGPHVLNCRRDGDQPVLIHLATRKQTCTFEAPAVSSTADPSHAH